MKIPKQPIELLPHVGVIIISLIALCSHADEEQLHSIWRVLLSLLLISYVNHSSLSALVAIISLMQLCGLLYIIGNGEINFPHLLSALLIALAGKYLRELQIDSSWAIAVMVLNIEAIAISSPALVESIASLVLVSALSLCLHVAGIHLCPQETFLVLGTVAMSASPVMNNVLPQSFNKLNFIVQDDIRLILTITMIGVVTTLIIGITAGAAVSACEKLLTNSLPFMRAATQSISFCVIAVVGVFFVMFPIMQIAISVHHPHIRHPLEWIAVFLLDSSRYRVWICVYWISALAVVLPLAQWVTSRYPQSRLPQICSRKIFHALCVIMFAPIVELDVHMLALSLGVATCGLLVVEYIRCFNACGINSTQLGALFDTFMDERDRHSAIALTHIELLVGCAAPVWMWSVLLSTLPPAEGVCVNSFCLRMSQSTDMLRLLPHFGWITVGLGDAMAAIVGSFYGRHKWIGEESYFSRQLAVAPSVRRRTVEGSVGCFLSEVVAAGLIVLVHAKLYGVVPTWCGALSITVSMFFAAAVETLSADRDNVVMPIAASTVYLALCSFF